MQVIINALFMTCPLLNLIMIRLVVRCACDVSCYLEQFKGMVDQSSPVDVTVGREPNESRSLKSSGRLANFAWYVSRPLCLFDGVKNNKVTRLDSLCPFAPRIVVFIRFP